MRIAQLLDAVLRRRGHLAAIVDPAEPRLPLLDHMYKEYEPGSAPLVLENLAQLDRKG